MLKRILAAIRGRNDNDPGLRTYRTTLIDLKRLIELRGPVKVMSIELSTLTVVTIRLTSMEAIQLRRQAFYLREV